MKTRLKELREARGLTLEEVAQGCGVTRFTVSKFENFGTNMGFATLCKLADFLGVTLDELRGDRDECNG